jgi:hypothetical protein
MSWVTPLHAPIHLDDGRIIETLADVRALVLSLPPNHQSLKKWQDIAHLLTRATDTGDVSLLGVVELSPKKPAAKSVRKRPSTRGRRRRVR